jgi:hypothetical protein
MMNSRQLTLFDDPGGNLTDVQESADLDLATPKEALHSGRSVERYTPPKHEALH